MKKKLLAYWTMGYCPYLYSLLPLMFVIATLQSCGGSQAQSETKLQKTAEFIQKHGGTLVHALRNPILELDPAKASDTESILVCDQMFERLVVVNAQSEVKPSLASSWSVSSDGLEYRFVLRPHVQFHDGTFMKSADVQKSFERQMYNKTALARDAFAYWQSVGMSKILKDISVENDSVVVFRLYEPNATFMGILSMPFCSIVHEAPSAQPIQYGTGPFALKLYQDTMAVLSGNPSYWRGAPFLDSIIFKTASSDSILISGMAQGLFQVAPVARRDEVMALSRNDQLRFIQHPPIAVSYLAMNMRRAEMKDLKIRQAVAFSVNSYDLIKQVYKMYGRPARSLIPPIMHRFAEDSSTYKYDADLAKQSLRTSEMHISRPLELLTCSAQREYLPDGVQIAEIIKNSLEQTGFKIVVVALPWQAYRTKLYNGQYDLAVTGWIADIPDPDNFYYPLLDEAGIGTGQTNNVSNYANHEMQSLLESARRNTDPAERAGLYKQIAQILERDLPIVPMVHCVSLTTVHKAVKNYPADPFVKVFGSVWLEE